MILLRLDWSFPVTYTLARSIVFADSCNNLFKFKLVRNLCYFTAKYGINIYQREIKQGVVANQ